MSAFGAKRTCQEPRERADETWMTHSGHRGVENPAVQQHEACYSFHSEAREKLLVKRGEFITLLGGAAAWPLAARAQQPAMPMVGFVTGLSSNYVMGRKPAFRRGLREAGYVEGQNVVVEYHSVEGQSDRLSGIVTDLI